MWGKFLTFVILIQASSLLLNAQSDLVGYWSFDEMKNDTIQDQSGNGYIGINYGADTVQGIKGKGLYFEGNGNGKKKSTQAPGDYVEIKGVYYSVPGVLRSMNTGAISLWFKVYEIPSDFGIAPLFYYGMRDLCNFFDAANKGLIIELGHAPIFPKNETIFFTVFKNGCNVPSQCFDNVSPVTKGKWHHYVAVVGEDYNTGYLDGEELTNRRYFFGNESFNQFFADALAHEKLWLGKGHWDETEQYFNGVIDEVRIYNKPLSNREVKNIYNKLKPVSTNVPSEDETDQISVYPNPASEKLYYDITKLGNSVREYRIMDSKGQVVKSEMDVSPRGNIDISNLPAGVYFVEFLGGTNDYRKKVLVQR